MLFYVLVAMLAAATLFVLVVPVLLWWALAEMQDGERPEALRPTFRAALGSGAIWRAFVAWQRERPLQIAHQRER